MSPRKHDHPFEFCPRCGREDLRFDERNRFNCESCGFVFYQNTAAACGAILTLRGDGESDRILLVRRGREPARGKLDFPGGFIDPGESAEAALAREIREEIGMEVSDLRYFHSAPNRYPFRDVLYHTCDLIFTGTIAGAPAHLEEGEIEDFLLFAPGEIRLEDIAFPSLREAMALYLGSLDAR
ncbi:MAG: NUDIX domain-containing protein [Spirochaetaceae bacterium]|nr:MAG: NUDIX domain-containing protein [Spirochaetaceae bacterium]